MVPTAIPQFKMSSSVAQHGIIHNVSIRTAVTICQQLNIPVVTAIRLGLDSEEFPVDNMSSRPLEVILDFDTVSLSGVQTRRCY